MKLAEMTVTEYLQTLASSSPAPGGGSAAALMGAQGAGLVAMVAAMSNGKKKYLDYTELYERIIPTCSGYVKELTEQIDIDTEAYNRVSAAFKLPKQTDEEIAARKAAIKSAGIFAAQVPFHTMELCRDGLKEAEALSEHYNTNCASDLGVGTMNLIDGMRGAWMNVRINLIGMEDEEAARLMAEGEAMMAASKAVSEAILAKVEQSL